MGGVFKVSMAKRTLIDMVQGILAEIGGDNVNSISDTQEATDIANLIKQTYFDIVDIHELPHNREIIALEGQADSNKPTTMRIPENVIQVAWMKYDVRLAAGDNKNYRDLKYKTPKEFIEFVNARPSTDTTNYLVSVYSANVPLVLGKLAGPTYWTSFDDEYIVFDSYDSNVDSTVQASKSLCEVEYRPTFTLSDSFTPDLPENLFGLLYSQARSNAFVLERERVNPKAEQSEKRWRVRSMRNKWREGRMINDYPDYGRRR